MIFATFALGFFCPRHACEERDCGGRCSNETISLRCADTEVIRLVLLQTADDIAGDSRDVMSGEVSSGDVDNPAGFCNATAFLSSNFTAAAAYPNATGPCAAHLLAAANAAVLRWVVAPRDKGWPCAQPIEDDALAQLRKDAGAGGTMLVTLRDSNAI